MAARLPEPEFRLNGNWLEATAALPVPANLGTPGAPNSQYVTNAGPAIYNVTHTPAVAGGQPAGGGDAPMCSDPGRRAKSRRFITGWIRRRIIRRCR